MSAFSNKGYSLIEILIATALIALVAYFAGIVQTNHSTGSHNTFIKAQTYDSLNLIAGHLQKYLSTGDQHIYGFSGYLSSNDYPIARMILPIPGSCADLSTSSCAQDTALLYAYYDHTSSGGLSAICQITTGGDWLVDLSNTSFGTATSTTGGFSVTDSSGNTGFIPVSANHALAYLNSPTATIWIATGAPILYSVTFTPPSTFLDSSGNPVNPACTSNFLPNGSGGYKLSSLYRIPSSPAVLQQWTSGSQANISSTDYQNFVGTPPMKAFTVNFRSIGHQILSSGASVFALNNCSVAQLGTGAQFSCSANPSPVLFSYNNSTTASVTKVSIREKYGLSMSPAPSPTPTWYELLGPGMSSSTDCLGPGGTCVPLAIPAPITMPVVIAGLELNGMLNSSKFSLYKQNVLNGISIQVFYSDGKIQVLNVDIPN